MKQIDYNAIKVTLLSTKVPNLKGLTDISFAYRFSLYSTV